ncbi:hatching enzyme 1.2 isoform X2 [Drosophila ficusphila]|uniref:hatching enzyme 1.2 isoform X2 n=1 Tax=Drosophila ficusphila TaxID=30025 RepID=UPI0007E719A1|nr:hatching enzyme 1.2 isoform X2 [Drosophila ficusphila]
MQKSHTNTHFFLLLVLLGIFQGDSMPLEAKDSHEIIDLKERELGDNLFGNPDEEITGTLAKAHNANSIQNPGEYGNYFEGDIVVHIEPRNGIRNTTSHWTGGNVPYVIEASFSPEELEVLNKAFEEYRHKTCVRFINRTDEKDYILITNNVTGCSSKAGRRGGHQLLNLQSKKCLSAIGIPIHELMHALGFYHEQSRPDRDEYIEVLFENIKPEMEYNFDKQDAKNVSGFGVPYDYDSVMHYAYNAFSKNGEPTLRARDKTVDTIRLGQNRGFSKGDLTKINTMYNCTNRANDS